MTKEKFDEISEILSEIEKYQSAIDELETHDFIVIKGMYFGDEAADYIADTSDRTFKGLKDCILDFMKSHLALLEKMFKES